MPPHGINDSIGATRDAIARKGLALPTPKPGPLLRLPNRLESGQNRLTAVEWWVTMGHPVARVLTAGVA